MQIRLIFLRMVEHQASFWKKAKVNPEMADWIHVKFNE